MNGCLWQLDLPINTALKFNYYRLGNKGPVDKVGLAGRYLIFLFLPLSSNSMKVNPKKGCPQFETAFIFIEILSGFINELFLPFLKSLYSKKLTPLVTRILFYPRNISDYSRWNRVIFMCAGFKLRTCQGRRASCCFSCQISIQFSSRNSPAY